MPKLSKKPIKKTLKSGLENTSVAKKENERIDFLDTGCITLNLAASQKGKRGGWARGRIINLVGDNSSGKCVKNCYVLTEKGMIKIDNLINDTGYFEYNENVSSFNNKTVETSHIYKEETDKTFKIKTEHGYEIEGTPEHPIMVWDTLNCDFKMVKLQDITENDFVVIQKNMNMFPKKPYRFKLNSEYRKNKKHKNGVNQINWNIPKNMSTYFATILGYFVADGNFAGDNTIQISNGKKYNQENICYCLSKLGINTYPKQNGVNISRKEFRDFVFKLFKMPENFTARFKYVPDCILQSTKEHQAAFLRSLIDCDGWYAKENVNLEYYTASKELASQVQLMLLNFGIFSSINSKYNKEYNHDYYTVRIFADDLIVYAQEIGTLKYSFNTNKPQKCMSVVPGITKKIWGDLNEVRESLGWTKNGVIPGIGRFPRFKHTLRDSNVSIAELRTFIDVFDKFMDTSFYRNLLNFNFTKIISKKEVNEKTFVYDFTIPENHLFWSNGMISHNTVLSIEALANAFHMFKKTGNLESYVFPKVKKLIMIYNNVEGVMDFPLEEMYGEDFVNSIEWISSKTCEEFGRDLQRRVDNLKDGECLLYVADSLDAMVSSAQKERTDKALKTDKDEDAAYGAEKAKYFSGAFFNNLCEKQQGKDATLFLVSQVRENIGGGMYAEKYKRTGGKALDFYSHQVCWLKVKEKLKKTFRGTEKAFGVRDYALFKKNKCAKPFREAEFNILFDYGLDNIGSMVDYLFGPKGKGVEWEGEKMSREELISLIEGSKKDKEKLISMVEKDWEEIENAVKPNRKSRWDD